MWDTIKALVMTLGVLVVSTFSIFLLPMVLSILVIIASIMIGAIMIFAIFRGDYRIAKQNREENRQSK